MSRASALRGSHNAMKKDITEWPETLAVGSNVLAGTDPEKILECTGAMIEKANAWVNPFGDGTTGERIVTILSDRIRCYYSFMTDFLVFILAPHNENVWY